MSAAQKIVARAQNLRADIAGVFNLGTIIEPVAIRLGEFITTLLLRHPDLRVSLSHGVSGTIIGKIVARQIHAGFAIGPVNDDRVSSHKIAPITFRIVGPVAWHAQISKADWPTIAAFPWIATPENCPLHAITRQMFAARGLTPKVVIEADQEHLLKKLVSSGIGLTLMREDVALASERKGELVVWPPFAETGHLYFNYLRIDETVPALQAVLATTRSIWQPHLD